MHLLRRRVPGASVQLGTGSCGSSGSIVTRSTGAGCATRDVSASRQSTAPSAPDSTRSCDRTGPDPATWNEALGEALAEIAGRWRIRRPGERIGVLGGARLANEDAYAWAKLARTVLRTDNFDAQLGDGLPGDLVAGLPEGDNRGGRHGRYPHRPRRGPARELPVLHLRLRQAAANEGLRIIDCSPVATGLSQVATWTPYIPGEAVGSRGSLSPLRPATAVVIVLGRPSLAGSVAEIAAAASVFASAWPSARFLSALPRERARRDPPRVCPRAAPGAGRSRRGRALFSEHWGSAPARRGLDAAGMLEAAAAGEIRALLLWAQIRCRTFPIADLATRALERVDFLVSVETSLNASSTHADVVLPAAGYAERGGTTTNLEGRVTRLAAKVVPPGVSRADWVIATELAARLGGDLGFESLEGIWAEIERIAPADSGCTCGRCARRLQAADGIVIPLKPASVQLTRRLPRLDPVATPGIDYGLRAGCAAQRGEQ